MTAACYRKNFEHGPWYEMFCLRRTIAGLEASGKDASFERELYAAWLQLPEYAAADKRNRREGRYGALPPGPGDAFKPPPTSVTPATDLVAKIADGINPPSNTSQPIFATSEKPVMARRGRPRKTGEDVSRWTVYRRNKEQQGALL